jgi:hypothetical protein
MLAEHVRVGIRPSVAGRRVKLLSAPAPAAAKCSNTKESDYMTNSMRWGLSSLTALGLLVAGGAIVGCSSSSSGGTTTPEDTGVDTEVPDTTVADANDSAVPDTGADVPDTFVPAVPDRKITIVHASPDAGAQLFCFGAGASNTLAKALIIGKPGITAGDASQYTGFTYGTVAPIAVPMDGLISKAEIDAIGALTVYAFPIGATNPLTAAAHDSAAQLAACSAAFAKFKTAANPDGGTANVYDTTKFISFPGSKLVAGASAVISATGCVTPAATPAGCFNKAMSLGVKLLDLTEPTYTVPDGSTGAKVAFHFMHASPFTGYGTTVPSFQAVDVYLLPRSKAVAGTDAGADADSGAVASQVTGAPVKIATNVSYGDVVGIQVPAGDAGTTTNLAQPFVTPAGTDAGSSLLIFMPTGVTFCAPGSSATCPALPLTLDPWLAGYQAAFTAAGYAPVGFVNNTHQMIILSGSISDDPANPTKYGLNLGYANVGKP